MLLRSQKGRGRKKEKGEERERERKGIPLTSSASLDAGECLGLASFLEFLTWDANGLSVTGTKKVPTDSPTDVFQGL